MFLSYSRLKLWDSGVRLKASQHIWSLLCDKVKPVSHIHIVSLFAEKSHRRPSDVETRIAHRCLKPKDTVTLGFVGHKSNLIGRERLPGEYCFIWVIGVRAAGQGMVFGLAVLNRVWYYEPRDLNPDCEQSLSFLRLRPRAAPYERSKEFAIQRRTSDLHNIN